MNRPTDFEITIRLQGFGVTAEQIADRVRACVTQHPTLSMRIEDLRAVVLPHIPGWQVSCTLLGGQTGTVICGDRVR